MNCNATKPSEPQPFMFTDDGSVPNNPKLPFLVYRGVVDLIGTLDPEDLIQQVFHKNGWGDKWRNGVYPYVHYHSMIHEVIGVARGRANVRFGGNKGREVELTQGDVAVLPAGTGHQCLWASPDLMVIGAYPTSGRYDLCRGSKREHTLALQTIPQVPLPDSDPVFGEQGPLMRLWRD
jgi:uncharacterized protein YjlB